jgi:hypothetical protein
MMMMHLRGLGNRGLRRLISGKCGMRTVVSVYIKNFTSPRLLFTRINASLYFIPIALEFKEEGKALLYSSQSLLSKEISHWSTELSKNNENPLPLAPIHFRSTKTYKTPLQAGYIIDLALRTLYGRLRQGKSANKTKVEGALNARNIKTRREKRSRTENPLKILQRKPPHMLYQVSC